MDFITTPERELEIIESGIDLLGLTFGDFWYQWFDSRASGNHMLDITSNVFLSKDKLRAFGSALSFIDTIIDVTILDLSALPGYDSREDFCYKHRIHFMSKT